MKFRVWAKVLFSGLLASAASGVAWSQSSYPKVYGSTGHPYGPTQAHYQYQRQYGQPWHGYGGTTASGPREHHITIQAPYFPGYYGGYGYGGYGYGGYGAWYAGIQNYGTAPVVYGPGYGYAPAYGYQVAPAPGLSFSGPGFSGSFGVINGNPGGYVPYPDYNWARNPAQGPTVSAPIQDSLNENAARWGQNLPDVPADPVTRPVAPSSTTARLRSIQAQARGDARFRDQKWKSAYGDYREAADTAPDRAPAYLRLGLAAAMLDDFATAAQSFKRAVHLDPELARTMPRLVDLFGSENRVALNSLISRATEYSRQDIRDPDRLFLMGVLLTMNDDPRAQEFFETGLRLAGRGQHFTAFLQAGTPPAGHVGTQFPGLGAPNRSQTTPQPPAADSELFQPPLTTSPLAPAPLPEPPATSTPALPLPPAPAAAPAGFSPESGESGSNNLPDGPTLLPPTN